MCYVCSCWDASPHGRPTFGQIAQCLQIMLDEQNSGPLTVQPPPAQLGDVWAEKDQQEARSLNTGMHGTARSAVVRYTESSKLIKFEWPHLNDSSLVDST